jgi:23S rRNA pseudouridine1911/1915/1917 synthase
MIAVNKPEGAKQAVTHYRILKQLAGYTLLEIEPDTGRKNHVRVHLAGLGCPLVGDRRYGAVDEVLRRIRLHAFYLGFIHPVSGRFWNFATRCRAHSWFRETKTKSTNKALLRFSWYR